MADPFLAEIRIFAGNFAPTGWALCNGQILAISQNTALFALLGTTYGGDGKTTFALPNLQGRVPIHQGQGPGLSEYFLGQSSGAPSVTLIQTEMPAHSHIAQANADASSPQAGPAPGNVWGALPGRPAPPPIYVNSGPNTLMSPNALAIAGSSQPHNNMQPYLGLTFIIALQGIFPPRS
jgi:microcystin-dependent protein